MRKPFSIGRFQFTSRAEAARRIRHQILDTHAHMQILKGEDDELLRALLQIHPDAHLILKTPVIDVVVEYRDGGRGFFARYHDSSIFDFKWMDALYPRDARGQLLSVCRHLAQAQIDRFRDENFRGLCHACNTPTIECEVHHASPQDFISLIDGWLASLHMTPNQVGIIHHPGHKQHSRMEDEFLAEAWIEYHEINARLQCLCITCHQAATKAQKAKETSPYATL